MSNVLFRFFRYLVLLLGMFAVAACTSTNPGTAPGVQAGAGGETAAPAHGLPPAAGTAANGGLRMVHDLPAPAATVGGTEQPIAPADVLEVFVFQVPDLSRTVQVDASGRITLPLIGSLSVAGKSVSAVRDMITRAYASNYLQDPQISVTVKSSASLRVTVDGEVNRSGVFPLPPTATLLDAIALAGGLNNVADTTKLYVFRKIEGHTLVANYDLSQIRSGARTNPRIFGGDVVIAFSSAGKVAMQHLREALGIAVPVVSLATP